MNQTNIATSVMNSHLSAKDSFGGCRDFQSIIKLMSPFSVTALKNKNHEHSPENLFLLLEENTGLKRYECE